MAKDNIPEVLNTRCCTWRRVHVTHRNRMILIRVGNTARSLYRWRCTVRPFPPEWHLYISEDDLTKQEIEEIKRKRGPTVTLLRILREIVQR